jgi:hypothetical protein
MRTILILATVAMLAGCATTKKLTTCMQCSRVISPVEDGKPKTDAVFAWWDGKMEGWWCDKNCHEAWKLERK